MEQVRTMVRDGLRRSGYDEVALTSLSSADFSGIDQLVGGIVGEQTGTGQVSLSLPSLRVDAFTVGVASEIQKVRRTGLTFAPEAGSWRLRQVINKLVTEEDLYSAVDSAFSQGWRRVKLYFLTGLPTESDADTLGIAELAKNVVAIGKRHTKGASATVSVGGFVPKPHTPFQWFGQNSVEELRRKIFLLRDDLRRTPAKLRWHDPEASFAEGIASRGDRRIGAVIERVWRAGRHVPGVERALRPRPAGSTRWPPRGSTPTGTSPGTARPTRSCPGTTSRPACTGTSSGRTGRRPSPSTGSPIAGGRRVMTAGCARGTRSSTSWRRTSRPAGGSQGTGQDLATGHTVPVQLLPTNGRAGTSREAPVAG